MRGKRHTVESKARALALLMIGTPVGDVAKICQLPDATVRSWAKSLGAEFTKVHDKNDRRLEELLFEYLRTSLDSLRVMANFFGDSEWLRQQSAKDLANLHSILFDEVFRMLEALERGAFEHSQKQEAMLRAPENKQPESGSQWVN